MSELPPSASGTQRTPRRAARFRSGVLGLVLASCSAISAPQSDTSGGSTPGLATASETTGTSHDLTDPAVISKLGAPEPEGIDWERSIDGTRLVGIDSEPVPHELDLIAATLMEVPAVLKALIEPRTIVRLPRARSGDPDHEEAVGYSVGPDIYLPDAAFSQTTGSTTLLDMTRTYVHELAHTAQFNNLDAGFVSAALAGLTDPVNPEDGSALVRDFAASTGWINESSDPYRADWRLSDPASAPSRYGATGPAEDMAETLSLIVLGRGDGLTSNRVRWVESWLGIDAEDLAVGKPWAPAGSVEVLARQPLYDEERVAALSVSAEHAEPLYLELDPGMPDPAIVAATIGGRLSGRGLAGALVEINDDRLPHYGGVYTRSDGVRFWVELLDFRAASGFTSAPADPVLIYVMFW